MDNAKRIADDVLASNEYALPSSAATVVEMALNHEEVTFVLEAPHAITFLTLHTDGTWEAEQA
jgi:hypothetical protein